MPSSEVRRGILTRAQWWRRRSIRARVTFSSLLIGVLAITAVSGISLLVLLQASDSSTHRVLVDRLATLQSRVTVRSGAVQVAESNDAVFDTTTWVFDQRGRIVDGTAIPAAIRAPLMRLSHVRVPTEELVRRYRLRAEPVQGGAAVIVVALDLGPYLSSLRDALAVTAAVGLLSAAALAGTAFAATGRVLKPVGQMARTAERWDRARLAERFDLGPPADELSELAAVLDRLLDRVATTIADEERLSAELAHELRTPLAIISGEAQLGLREPSSAAARLQRIEEASTRMATTIHTLLDVARGSVGEDELRTDVGLVIAAALAATPERGEIEVVNARQDRPLFTSAPPLVLERVLTPLLENGIRHADQRVTVSAKLSGRVVQIDIENDGVGVAPDMIDHIFQPGVRSIDSPGSGLGLPLAARLAASVNGRVVLERPSPVLFRVEVPALR